MRVNVQLIKAANDSHLWADTFDRKLTDIFSVESEVARSIADQLRVHLSGPGRAIDRCKTDRQSSGLRCLLAWSGLYVESGKYTRQRPWRTEIS